MRSAGTALKVVLVLLAALHLSGCLRSVEDPKQPELAAPGVTEEEVVELSEMPPESSSVPAYLRGIPTEWYDIASSYPYPLGDPRPMTRGRIEVRPDLWLIILPGLRQTLPVQLLCESRSRTSTHYRTRCFGRIG